MSKLHPVIASLALLLATGAGCLGFGDKGPSVAVGGMWVSENGGSSWLAKSVLPTATGSSSIDGLDILAIEQDPSDTSAFYLGTKTSGLFYSLDAGESWLRPEDKIATSGSVLAIEVDPRNVCTYYALKSDRVIKTTSCGRDFDHETYVETRTDESLTTLALDWYDPDTLYLGTSEGDVLRSLDGGGSWSAILRARNPITAIAISNADSRIVLVGTHNKGAYRSVDGGLSWTDTEQALSGYSKAANVYGVSQTDNGGRMLMRSAYGLLASDDRGLTWKPIYLVTSAGEVALSAAAIARDNPQVIYYTAGNIFYTSTTGGQAWSTANLPTTRAAAVIHVDAGNSDRVYLGVMTPEK